MKFDILIRNAYLWQQNDTFDVGIEAGRIARIAKKLEASAGGTTINADGKLLSPCLIDSHLHMDKSMTSMGGRVPKYNDFRESDIQTVIRKRIDAGLKYYRDASVEEVKEHTLQHAYMCIANGVLFTRTFADIDSIARTKAVEGVLAAREQLKELIDIQVVAFAQSGFLADPDAETLVREALDMGADLVGSLDPATVEHDIERGLDAVFKIAKEFDVDVDNHIMDIGTLGIYTLQRQAEKAVEHGYTGRVTAGHSFALGDAPQAWIQKAIPAFKEADMRFVTCYKSSPYRMPVKQLLEAGITVAIASDNVRDFWRAYGNADPLQAALIELHRLDMNTNSDLDLLWRMITVEGAKVLGIEEEYGIEEGKKANLVLFDSLSPHWAIIDQARKLYVIRNGKIIAADGKIKAECLA
jgi:cytosine/adenosine deaminase-related metal-dependent hydrolase